MSLVCSGLLENLEAITVSEVALPGGGDAGSDPGSDTLMSDVTLLAPGFSLDHHFSIYEMKELG